MIRALVYGYYKTSPNLGDHLFTLAFQQLFPDIEFKFVDHITSSLLEGISIVIFGGGSFLDQAPDIENQSWSLLDILPIFYLSVGAETNIHPIHQKLIKQAKLVAIRSPHLSKIQNLNNNTIMIPDLVYSLHDQIIKEPKQSNSILYIPNINVVPKYDDPYWKHISWEKFVIEMAQTLDNLIKDGYTITSYAMEEDDNCAFVEIANRMHQNPILHSEKHLDIPTITKLFSQYQCIITQRYHGAVLAEMSGTNYLCLYHHDKLRQTFFNLGIFSSYYEVSKEKLTQNIELSMQNNNILSINPNIFTDFVHTIQQCLKDMLVSKMDE